MRTFARISMVLLPMGCGDDSGATADAGMTDAAQSWMAAAAMPDGGVQETAVVALDGKLYVIGGFDAAIQIQSKVRVFDTATSTWSEGAALPQPLHHANAAVVGETIYVLGALTLGSFTPINDVYAWNPKTDASWTVKSSMPAGTQRGAAVAGAIGNVIYVVGGARGGNVADLSAYSTTNDTWNINLPALPQPTEHACGGVVGGKLYVMGGRYQGNTPLTFEYTPGGAWAAKASMPTARSGMACGVFNDQIITAGGELNPANPESVFADVEAYSATTDTWRALPPMTTPRHGMGGAVWDGVFYVPGGATVTGFAAVDTHETLPL